ncbi:MAG: hypothetical protein R6W76_12495 [Caldilinea sp.]
MPDDSPPTRLEFLTTPTEAIANFAPACMVYAAAGTRRQAALAGIRSDSEEYAHWSRTQMLTTCNLVFEHGVKHIFTILATPGQFQEIGRYRTQLLDWIDWGVAGSEALADYCRLGWRVRLVGAHEIEVLAKTRRRLCALPDPPGAPTLWYWVIPDVDAPWRWLRDAICSTNGTRADAIRALYSEEVPPVTLYLAFGKPIVADYLLPPLLGETVQCYWTQRPGYALTQNELRTILYDYAFLRPTWRADKTLRGEEAIDHRASWERATILGLGRRLGPFWYPELDSTSTAPEINVARQEAPWPFAP